MSGGARCEGGDANYCIKSVTKGKVKVEVEVQNSTLRGDLEMPVLCDFTQIVGDTPVNIGDALPVWEATFNTGGRHAAGTAFLIFNVRGLTFTNVNVNVKINNQVIGEIVRYGGLNDAEKTDTAKYWYTQMIAMNGSTLNNGNNEIQIEAVGWPGATNTNKFDDFELKDVICFFHQST